MGLLDLLGCCKSAIARALPAGQVDAQGNKLSDQEFQQQTAEALKGDVRMFSGCMDHQTSADVKNVAAFGLPPVNGPEAAGGACTNAMLSTLQTQPDQTYAGLLINMQQVLKQRRYSQVPQLSSSRKVDLQAEKFSFTHPAANGQSRALLIGINYVGQQGQLSGCVNDARMMKSFLVQHGYSESPEHMQLLTDDPNCATAPPTAKNILAAMEWLVKDAQPGDSLFLHYSGHGGQLKDDGKEEKDGFDETIIPVDYQTAGQIRDDTIFKLVVAPLKEGVRLCCVFDCCHSATVMDLPFEFNATSGGVQELQQGGGQMHVNPNFSLAQVLNLVSEVARGLFSGEMDLNKSVALAKRAASMFAGAN